MTKISFYQKKTDAQRRLEQAKKYARILFVAENMETSDVHTMAKQLGVCTRTICRDIKVIKLAKELKNKGDM